MFQVRTQALPAYEIVVAGGGMAGVCAAIRAGRLGARVLLVEGMGCLGGALTHGLVPQVLDADNKGGLVRELYERLDRYGMSCPRSGPRVDAQGKKLPGRMIDIEGAKECLDAMCAEAGVDVLLYSRVAEVEMDGAKISRVLLSTETGNYAVQAKVFVDATGGGALSALCGCEWACGAPDTGMPQPATMAMQVAGLPPSFNDTANADEKSEYGEMLLSHGIQITGTQAATMKLPSLQTWLMAVNFEYGVLPTDIVSLSRATIHGRRECIETAQAHARIPGYERYWMVSGCEHIGLREGRRIRGQYWLTLEDILSGARFEDAICTVHFNIDIHKLHNEDTVSTNRGYRTKPYHIPYRSLLPLGVDNLLLAGRLISGDFYAHASYRVMGNMAATGEAAGIAAVRCINTGVNPAQVRGTEVSREMMALGYEIADCGGEAH